MGILKEKYEEDLAAFVNAGGEVKARKTKKIKDPNAPKRAQTAYMLWLNESRARLAKSLPEGANVVTGVAKKGGAEWKKLGAQAKAPYEKKAQQAKEEYEKAMGAYMAS